MSRALKMIPKIVLPVLVIALGVMGSKQLVASREAPARQQTTEAAPLVEVIDATPQTQSVTVEVMGVVKPARTLVVTPQVGGAITGQHEQLVPGGFLTAGERLVEIDKRDYKLAVQAQQAQVARATLEVRVEKGRRSIAAREWEAMEASLGEGGDDEGRDLAMRDPQIAAANASLSSARSAVKTARLSLSRTDIDVPFNAVVQSEAVEIGQIVGPASRLATLIGTDTAWVEASIPVERLAWLAIPGVSVEAGAGAAATVIQTAGSSVRVERRGQVIRLLGDVEPGGRMARVLIEIPDPYGLQSELAERGIPLLVGSFVRVQIQGRSIEDAIAVPRVALREDDTVWVVADDGTLTVQPVVVSWREADQVLVTKGLAVGARVVTSVLAAPVPGMALRLEGSETAAGEPTEEATP